MSVTAPAGFVAGGLACGIKADDRPDLALVDAGRAVPAAAVFTANGAAAAPVVLSRAHAGDGSVRAVVLNSGCANAATGPAGMEAAEAMARSVADRLGCEPTEVVVCSTGPIGPHLPLDRVTDGIARMELDPNGGGQAAEAILTTDTRAKQETWEGRGYRIGGMAKGAGMVRPDLATMLAVITTDADLEAPVLREAIRKVADRTFNALDIDGCESTNDTVILLASGESGTTPDPDEFTAGLEELCRSLTHQMADDAEGASKVVTVELTGADTDADALTLARAVADSALVRASFYGADPNWGRVLAAMGATRLPLDPHRVTIAYQDVVVAEGGMAADFDSEVGEKLNGDFTVSVTVGEGPGTCLLYTTDLTPEYVVFNGEPS